MAPARRVGRDGRGLGRLPRFRISRTSCRASITTSQPAISCAAVTSTTSWTRSTSCELSAFYTNEPTVSPVHSGRIPYLHPLGPERIPRGLQPLRQHAARREFRYPDWMPSPTSSCSDLGAGLQIGPDYNAPQFTIQNLYQGVDNFSWTKGSHTLKFGGEYRGTFRRRASLNVNAATTNTTPPSSSWKTFRPIFSVSAALEPSPTTATRRQSTGMRTIAGR